MGNTDLYLLALVVAAITLALIALFKRPKNGYHTLTDTIASLSAHVKDLETEAAASRGTVRRLEDQLSQITRIAAGYSILRDQLFRLGHQPEHDLTELDERWLKANRRPGWRAAAPDSYGLRTELKTGINLHFNLDEMAELCARLGVDIEDFSGGKGDRVSKIVDYFDRRAELGKLLEVCIEMRPRAPWPTLP